MSVYTSCGKQVLRDGQHFGDMLTPEDAARVARLLNRAPDWGFLTGTPIEPGQAVKAADWTEQVRV